MADKDRQPDNTDLVTRQRIIVTDDGPNAVLLDTGRFEQLQQLAKLMGSAPVIPEHLRGVRTGQGASSKFEAFSRDQIVANCFLIANRALRWGMDPFAVAEETYVLRGKLGFQGKLIAAVVNARAGLKSPLRVEFAGKGDALTATVSGTLKGEDEPRTVTLSVGAAKTDNGMWTRDPEQKLWYSTAIRWARRHSPETISGILTDDDLDRIRQEQDAAESQVRLPENKPSTVIEIKSRPKKLTEENPPEPTKSDTVSELPTDTKPDSGLAKSSQMQMCRDILASFGVETLTKNEEGTVSDCVLSGGQKMVLSDSPVADLPDGVFFVDTMSKNAAEVTRRLHAEAKKAEAKR